MTRGKPASDVLSWPSIVSGVWLRSLSCLFGRARAIRVTPPVVGSASRSWMDACRPRGSPSILARIVRIRWRYGCPICSVAPRSQAPKPHRGAPKARGFTARARTELSSAISRKGDCGRETAGGLPRGVHSGIVSPILALICSRRGWPFGAYRCMTRR